MRTDGWQSSLNMSRAHLAAVGITLDDTPTVVPIALGVAIKNGVRNPLLSENAMGKMKAYMMELDFLKTQQTSWSEQDLSGLLNMDSTQAMLLEQALNGVPTGNNSSCPSTTVTDISVASKPKTST
jgi:hypothetical protein